jgi:hypothetical protein
MADRTHFGTRRDSNLMRSVNTNLRSRSESVAADEPIAFFCECAASNCYSPIWMSSQEFDRKLVDEPGWLLHESHDPSALWHRREPLPTRTSSRHARPAPEPEVVERRVRLRAPRRVSLLHAHGTQGHAKAA